MVEVKTTTRKRVRRATASASLGSGLSRHFWNLLVVLVVGSITIAFLLIQQHEANVRANDANGNGGDPSNADVHFNKPLHKARHNAHSAERMLLSGKPYLIYGTAWKEDQTSHYVMEALESGFRFIDTAAQPKHYNEAGVGQGWTKAAENLGLDRSELFLQTKYSPHQHGTGIPFNPKDPLPEQVRQSVKSSLQNLQTSYLDSLILHSPLPTDEETLLVWRTMEELVDEGTVKRIGISNCYDLTKFQNLYENAKHKPWALQNRFYADSHFDTDLRKFCQQHKIHYQSFWTLTANAQALRQKQILEMAEDRHLTPQTLMYAFLMSLKGNYVTPLSGSKNRKHMVHDIQMAERIQHGEAFFRNERELREMAQLLGMPDL